MQTTIYIPDNPESKQVMKRIEVFKELGYSFSDCCYAGLKLLVSAKRPPKKDFRSQKLSKYVHT